EPAGGAGRGRGARRLRAGGGLPPLQAAPQQLHSQVEQIQRRADAQRVIGQGGHQQQGAQPERGDGAPHQGAEPSSQGGRRQAQPAYGGGQQGGGGRAPAPQQAPASQSRPADFDSFDDDIPF